MNSAVFDRDIAASLVKDMFETVNELLPVDVLGVAVYSEDNHSLNYAFSPVEDENEEMREMMARSFDAKTPYWREKDRVKCLPLWVEAGNENRCTGVLALKIALPVEREDDRLMLELVAGYVAIIVYNAVVLMAQKYRDFRSEMEKIDNPMIRQVRGKGLLNAVVTEPRGGKTAWDICLALKEKGLIAKPTHDHIIRFTPPLVIDRDQMMEAIGIIKDTFAQF